MTPTIKGIFVRQHIKVLGKQYGEKALNDLYKKFKTFSKIKNSDDVPIEDEIDLLEYIVQKHMYNNKKIALSKIEYDAGKIHFENFIQTPIARILLPSFKMSWIRLARYIRHIAAHVMKGVEFKAENPNSKTLKVTMSNSPYPFEHFLGFFDAVLESSYTKGNVVGNVLREKTYEYIITWK